MADQGTYYARLLPLQFTDVGLRSMSIGGLLFTPGAGYLPVTPDLAAHLATIRRVADDPTSPLAFIVLAPGQAAPPDPPPPPEFSFPTYPGDPSPPGPASSTFAPPA